LPALLRGEDELVIFGDGLLIESNWACDALIEPQGHGLRKTVFCIASDHPFSAQFPEDFERVDAEKCWAGLLAMRAAPAQQLADFPGDGDAVSLLLRLALQAHTPCSILSKDEIERAQFVLADRPASLRARELALVHSSGNTDLWSGPGLWAAERIARLLSPRAFGLFNSLSAVAAVAMILLAIVLAGIGHVTPALALLAVGVFSISLTAKISAIESVMLNTAKGEWIKIVDVRLVNLLVAGALGLAIYTVTSGAMPLIAMAILAVGLAHLAANSATTMLAAMWSDRVLHITLLTIAAGMSRLPEALALLGLLALGAALFETRGKSAKV
jgi:multisubunit Na+/H+ antiporter MnhB subunit